MNCVKEVGLRRVTCTFLVGQLPHVTNVIRANFLSVLMRKGSENGEVLFVLSRLGFLMKFSCQRHVQCV